MVKCANCGKESVINVDQGGVVLTLAGAPYCANCFGPELWKRDLERRIEGVRQRTGLAVVIKPGKPLDPLDDS